MFDSDDSLNRTHSCETHEEANGKDATYRNAPMISVPQVIVKQRIRGALVPMKRQV
jgi:hypothetical protein